MQTTNQTKLFIFIAILGLTSVMCSTGLGGEPQPTPTPITALIKEISGQVQVLKPVEGQLRNASLEENVEVNDQVLTHEDSRARIDLSTGTIIRMSPLSTFVLEEIGTKDTGPFARLKLEVGKVWIILNGGTLDIDTPTGKASVRGSYLHVWVLKDTGETIITCLEGECSLGNDAGAVRLVAGESATISNVDEAPAPGEMNDEDVDEWLDENPEATLVVIPLTATVAAREDKPKSSPTPTETPLPSPTPTATSSECGPSSDWVIYTVQKGETVESLAEAFRIKTTDLRHANCFSKDTSLVAGIPIFVPNTPTSTPIPSETPVPTQTPTHTATDNPDKPTSTATHTPTSTATDVPPDGNASFTPIKRPPNNISQCFNIYEVDVDEPDSIDFVKVYYAVNGKVGKGSVYLTLDHISGIRYKGNYIIDTSEIPGDDVVRYRFAVWDKLGNKQFFPPLADPGYSYRDNLDCHRPAKIYNVKVNNIAPDPGGVINSCSVTFSIDAEDQHGIQFAYIHWGIDDKTGSNFDSMTHIGGSTYSISSSDFSTTSSSSGVSYTLTANQKIYYHFEVKDSFGIYTVSTNNYNYVSSASCP